MDKTSLQPPLRGFGKPEATLGSTFRAVTIRPSLALLSILIVITAGVLTSVQAPNPKPDQRSSERSFWDWLRYPLERYPGLRLPRAPDDLFSTSFATNGLEGIAVGRGGTILATNDGGNSWLAQDSGVSSTLADVYVDASGKRAWAVGSNGTILRTVDGGKLWSITPSPVNDPLRAVRFMRDGTRGWIAGHNGIVLLTTDGGNSWFTASTVEATDAKHREAVQSNQRASSSVTRLGRRGADTYLPDLESIHFTADGKRGWAVAVGTIWTSVDGGLNWSEQETADGVDCFSGIKFADDGQYGWIAGCKSTVLVTRDGGKRWAKLRIEPYDEGMSLTSVEVSSDGHHVWLTRDDGIIFRSTDGGKKWSTHRSGANGWLSQVRFSADGKRGWAVGNAGMIMSSDDGGRHWTTRTSSNASTLNAIHLDSAGRQGWAVGCLGIVLSTTDAGRNWSPQASNVDRCLLSVTMLADSKRGWAVGEGGTIIATVDGGKTWRAQQSGTDTSYLSGVSFLDDGQRGWVVGSDGLVLSTTNGGQEWRARQLESRDQLFDVHFEPRGLNGWLVATNKIYWTANGGQTWQRASLNSTYPSVISVRFDDLGRWGLAVGPTGTIFASKDGGQTWEKKVSGTNATLVAVHIAKEGEIAWVVGGNGTLVKTTDGGETWIRSETKVGSGLGGVGFASDGMRGIAVGYPPGLLKTDNGGASWEPIPWPLKTERYPAPWFWIMLIPAGFLLLKSVRINLQPAAKGVEAIAASDAPVSEFARDRLQFGPLARGISRFLRNTNTQPPLTMAISGDWGSGKSTLMGLVCTDLRRYGVRPVWFNAWHHQQEEQLLSALLNAIRHKGLPPIGSADGLAFRLRLLTIRSKKHFVVSLVVIAATAAVLSYLLTHGLADWTSVWSGVTRLTDGMVTERPANGAIGSTWLDAARLLPQLVAGLAALAAVGKGLKAFNVDPAVLLSSTAEKFRLRDASAQTSFRSRFAEQFGEVTDALPCTMVIVIDDLDRCQPQTVLTVMEAVNFLVSSGKCFVLFGMATHRVQAVLGLTFKEVANELHELSGAAASATSPEVAKQIERERRLTYARDYLEKLINLEVVVPARSDIPPHLLVEASASQRPNQIAVAIAQALEFWPSWLAGIALLAGALIGIAYTPRDAAPAVNIVRALTAEPPVTSSGLEQSRPEVSTPAPTQQRDPNRYLPAMQKAEPVAIDPWLAAITAILFTAVAGGLMLYRLRAASNAMRDSETYADALRIWMPVIQQYRGTPRAIKRFGNRLRYLAMLQQEPKYDESGVDVLPQRIARLFEQIWTRSRTVKGSVVSSADYPSSEVIREPLLVALASLHEVNGARWREQLVFSQSSKLQFAISTAIESYRSTPGATWPPDDTSLDVFDRLLKGVRIADDGNHTTTLS